MKNLLLKLRIFIFDLPSKGMVGKGKDASITDISYIRQTKKTSMKIHGEGADSK